MMIIQINDFFGRGVGVKRGEGQGYSATRRGAGGAFIAVVSSVTHCIILIATDLYHDFLVNCCCCVPSLLTTPPPPPPNLSGMYP